MQLTERPKCAPTATAPETRLRGLGFTPGRPPTYAPMSAAVDRQTARRMACRCGRRGLGCRHYHKDQAVRAVAVCPACNASEEM